MSKLDELAQSLGQEIARLMAEEKALKVKIESLRLTEQELTARIGDHMENLKVKQRLEDLQAKTLKWVATLP
jgi:hypothetical protein